MKRSALAVAAAALAAMIVTTPGTATATSSPSPTPTTSGAPVTLPDQSSGPRPVMIVLDTSGSMDDGDGHGVRKLDGARDSLVNLIRQLPSRADVGLWAYPGGASNANGCDAGRTVVKVGPLDRTSTSAQIRAMTANGDTPTADALRAAVDQLKAAGYKGATLLLVSDGEANCGGDPCPVAQQLRDQGFDVTVQALGFQLSPAGAQQLQCIAHATGGSYHDVADSSQLLPDLIAAASPDISLNVQAPTAVPPQDTGTITASVTNTTPNDAHNIVMTLSLATPAPRTGSAKTAVPAVLNPVIRVGNVPAGKTVTRSWTFSSGLPDQDPRTVSWKVTSFGQDVSPAAKSGTLTLTGRLLTLADAGGWLRDMVTNGGRAVILGDSYSAGEGTGRYYDESNRTDNRCHRSPDTYAMSLFPKDRQPKVLACSGAVIANLFTPKFGSDLEIPQLQKLDQLGYSPDIAFMTIGGNDIMFAPLIADCALAGRCDTWLVDNPAAASMPDMPKTTLLIRTEMLIAQTRARLVVAYEQVARALNTPDRVADRGGKIAQLVILAYPAVLPLSGDRGCSTLSGSEIRFGNRIVRDLNSAISEAVRRTQSDGYPVHYVADNVSAVQPDHTMCDAQPWINPLDLTKAAVGAATWSVMDQELVHPNAAGYQAFTQRIIDSSQSDTLLPFTAPLPLASDAQIWEQSIDPTAPITLDLFTDLLNNPNADGLYQVQLDAGVPVVFKVAGFADGSPVLLTSYSQPRALGSFTADSSGAVTGTIVVPADLPPGIHRIFAQGFGADGRPITKVMVVAVAEPLPWPVKALPVLALLLVLAASVLAGVAWRRRRSRGRAAST